MHGATEIRWLGKKNVGIALLFCLIVFLLNANDLTGFFVGDDLDILRLIKMQDGLLDALRMTYVGTWGPVSYGQFYLNYVIGGLDPIGYHLVNLFWLSLTVVALYAFVRLIWREAPFAAWTAALLFATHPVHDEAISYICGRSHAAAAAMGLLALVLYARARLYDASPTRRAALLSASLLAAFVAALSKESAWTIPAWIVAFDWVFIRSAGESLHRSAWRALKGGALFGLAVAAVPLVRHLVVGGLPRKLEKSTGTLEPFVERFVEDVPLYALYGALPIPFSWIDSHELGSTLILGWFIVAAAFVVGLLCFYMNTFRGGRWGRAAEVYVLGLVIASVTLAPLLYADVDMRRRYLFISSIGIALMAAAAFQQLHARLPRATRALLAILLLAGAVGVLQRNELYRRSGNVSKNLIELVARAPLTRDVLEREPERAPEIALITLPRRYGGGVISGAHLLHWTDVLNAMALVGVEEPELSYAMKAYYAEDYTAEAEFERNRSLIVTVTFRKRRAFDRALARIPRKDRRGSTVSAKLMEAEPMTLMLKYRVVLKPGFWQNEDRDLLLYSDGKMTRLHP